MWTFIVVFVLLTAGYSTQAYDNSVGGNLYRCCPYKQVVSQIKSSYSSYDRRWRIECMPLDTDLSCSWTDFFNLYEKELNFNCPDNGVIRGLRSNYESAHKDRQWSILCCTAPKLITSECQETPMVNYWNEDFDWCVPGDNILTGIQTRNRNNGDHRWSFRYCRATTQKDYLHKNGEWDNQLGGVLSRQCPSGQVVSGITSIYNDGNSDRLWGISCKALKETGTCRLTSNANGYCADFNFKCGENEVIAGAYSHYHSYYRDREWRFYCCRVPGFVLFNCKEVPKINYWKENFSWAVPSSNFLTGVKSDFDNPARDRRWSFTYCQIKRQ